MGKLAGRCVAVALFTGHVSQILLVFRAERLADVGVRNEDVIELDRHRAGECFGIVDRDTYAQPSKTNSKVAT